jgi:hypothetical protein
MRFKTLLLITGALVLGARAATPATSIDGVPVVGYALDASAHAIRAILGIPGAAILGDALNVGFPIRRMVTGNAGAYAIAVTADTNEARLIELKAPFRVTPLEGITNPGVISVSPAGTAAAIYNQDGTLELLTGLTAAKLQRKELRLEGPPVALAVTDDGNFALVAFANPDRLILAGQDGARISIPAPGTISALGFRPDAYDALAATTDNRIWSLPQSSLNFLPVAGPEDGISDPISLAYTPDGRRTIVSSGSGLITILDLAAGTASTVRCACHPAKLEQLASPRLFRLNELSDEPLFMLDADSGRVLFVPPVLRQESGAAGEAQ